MNPDRYAIIYNSKYDNNNKSVFDSSTTKSSSSCPPRPHSPILQNQNYYNVQQLKLSKDEIAISYFIHKTFEW
jgi:hypothetical protein